MKKKIIFIIIPVIVLIAGILFFVFSGSEGSRSITVISISGDEAYITRDSDKQFVILEGTRFAAGNTVTTGSTTTIDVQPGGSSPVRINESTEVYISELSKNNLTLTVINGSISDISSEHTGDDSDIHAGNITMGLRGVTNNEDNNENNMLVITRDDISSEEESSDNNADDTSSWWVRLWENLTGWLTR